MLTAFETGSDCCPAAFARSGNFMDPNGLSVLVTARRQAPETMVEARLVSKTAAGGTARKLPPSFLVRADQVAPRHQKLYRKLMP